LTERASRATAVVGGAFVDIRAARQTSARETVRTGGASETTRGVGASSEATTIVGGAFVDIITSELARRSVAGGASGTREGADRIDTLTERVGRATAVVGFAFIDVDTASRARTGEAGRTSTAGEANREERSRRGDICASGASITTAVAGGAFVDVVTSGETSSSEATRAGRAVEGAEIVDAGGQRVARALAVVGKAFVDIRAGLSVVREGFSGAGGASGARASTVEVGANAKAATVVGFAFIDINAAS
jgi:hypothetical protein